MTAIKHALQRDIFTPNDERLLSIVNVCKAGKKKRNCFLCATVTTERPVQVNVVKVKKSDKGDFYKRQTAWALRDLAVVDAKDAVKENPEFDLHFDKVYKWVASSTVEKNTFISCIWKLNQRYLRKKIDFTNVSSQLLEELPKVAEESVPSGENQSVAGGDEEAVDEYQELNAREEQDIEIMMEGCEYAISNAEAFAEKLSRELQVLDGANIQSIMASEKQVNILMKLLDEALKEVDQIEIKLSSYEEMLQSVKEQMDQISESNHLIHLSNTNNVKLLSEIEFLVNHMDLAKGHIKALQEGDLTSSRGIEACTNAADALLQCMNVALRPGHDMLHAVKQQQQRFSDLREQFARRLASHLNSVFVQQFTQTLLQLYNKPYYLSVPGHDQSSTLAQHSVELTLPNHHPFHRDLLRYAKLMEWLKNTDYGKYEGLTKNYMDYLSRLYEREIKDFFEVAKIKMTGTTKEGKKFATLPRKESAVKQETESLHGSSGKLTGSTSSLNKLSVQSSGNRRSQSSSLLDMGNMSASDLDVADRTKFDKIFEQVLSELEPLCLAEQDFISKFFKLQQHQGISGSTTNEAEEMDGGNLSRSYPSGVPQTISSEKDMIRQMMTKIFRCIEPELNNLIALGDKIDSFNSLYMLVKMSHHVWTAQNVDPASFLSTTLGNVLVTVKRNFDKCISNQMKQMDEVKISKKSKVGILPFVAEFEEFAALAESIFKNAERRGDLDKAYIKLIRAVFVSVEKVANESQKTPRDVVMMENFHHIFATLSRLKISCLEAEKKEAKQKYTDHLQSYVIYSLGQPLEKLNHFFEGVEARVAQGIREEEVSYQLAFNKQELRKVIKEYPGKEVKKGLDNLYKKVDKHLCEEENLLQVVWHSMQDEFIRQYKHFEGLIARCYPGSGITMEFTIQDILDYCSSIAQSH
ncbi:exocyst complex component 1 isoform X1 [Anas acuta]|uniref:Exocyst complex component 1 n=2 Tax=Anas TaxID=8835 RepID=A0A8B9V7R0_9AVES|nr:exocyst complex component 1 isoform X1 [Anas platyrhynchos]XP_027312864.1 exocyst complex component 1 isoform X1 [Anas platyrhynchos]XP_047930391.1 exocyst complex component 1 isoform X1 [Anser cygnoides]XP_047930394.1 exocyst complex component 1 isoform X1 [Anser cygnoides]XP_047930395.1 exocyst complex component 1 isoform X1 [Anser cygnoides]XP_047930396.1 exocyst complex component 1 isoform X1 [Anser cygnoides]XP_047930397.1 exocyst complex component 1 isoform X1 [Anser cygnoides]|eukprot:XP_021123321.1 exocyst complex component 1 isoform X1 [Anas platyrhynchos]